LKLQSRASGDSDTNDAPKVSVVILTKNAGPKFRSTLENVAGQRTGHTFEIIVVDSGSKDETLDIANEFRARTFTIRPEDFTFGLTRNYGFSLSRGEYIATISQDAVPRDSDWLENLVRPFLMKPEVVAVQGAEAFPSDGTVFYWLKHGCFYFTSDVKEWVELYGCGLSFTNCAVRRSFWQTHPIGFTPFSEDKLFQREIWKSGREIAAAKDAVCIHGHQYSCRSLVTRLVGEGMGYAYAGVNYGLRDCVSDVIGNKWMLRESFCALWRREITAPHEVFFLFFRPICSLWGNRRKRVPA
jgi:rhamnosyltransferase